MKTVKVSLFIVIFAVVFILGACEFGSGGKNPMSSTVEELPKVSLYAELASMIDVRNEISAQAALAAPAADQLRAAFLYEDIGQIRTLLGTTPEQEADWKARLDEAVRQIRAKQSEWGPLSTDPDGECDIDGFFDLYFEKIIASASLYGNLGKVSDAGYDDDVDCDYFDYVMALAGCTALGPYLYWICSYYAMCNFCDGGWVSEIC